MHGQQHQQLPSPRLERIAGLALPAAVREEVLGDLHEFYRTPLQYLGSLIRVLPSVLFCRIRRTIDPSVTLMVSLLLLLGHLGMTQLLEVEQQQPNPDVLLLLPALLVGVSVTGIVLTDAYAVRQHPLWAPLVGTALAWLALWLIALAYPGLAMPTRRAMVLGSAAGLVLASGARLVFRFDRPRLQAAGGGSSSRPAREEIADSAGGIGSRRWMILVALMLAWALARKAYGL